MEKQGKQSRQVKQVKQVKPVKIYKNKPRKNPKVFIPKLLPGDKVKLIMVCSPTNFRKVGKKDGPSGLLYLKNTVSEGRGFAMKSEGIYQVTIKVDVAYKQPKEIENVNVKKESK